jgi:hypothetical protein
MFETRSLVASLITRTLRRVREIVAGYMYPVITRLTVTDDR